MFLQRAHTSYSLDLTVVIAAVLLFKVVGVRGLANTKIHPHVFIPVLLFLDLGEVGLSYLGS